MELLLKYRDNDSIDGGLVFYTYPGASTRNSSYSRTEFREPMVPGSNFTNWTFKEGGMMTRANTSQKESILNLLP